MVLVQLTWDTVMDLFTEEHLIELRHKKHFKQAVLTFIQPDHNIAKLNHLELIKRLELDIQELKCSIEMLGSWHD